MTETDPQRSLEDEVKDLDERLKKAREAEHGPPGKGPRLRNEMTGMGLALRIGTEMISALIMGVGIGWLLDDWLGTGPWMMILFFFLGAGAGVLNVYRAASRLGAAPDDGDANAPPD
ncbi:MAG: AtpZ/AtpI family protein [Alphaproteobacteria bacterium]|nr:AtpZ/AtpI family protein [Alphaproteobacteria bacterium]MBF0250671.1 AtpZ/AtpI family protein [Alphaproteobacteria bacterium]